ncbi:uroporphyrinogen-III synthase [Candidatus Pelagibacter sp.]|nr:uroporphyrinogen-III synthase [Candidatus Pelagibacter sp.]
MHILLTRPLEDCSEMILKFQSLGHQVSHLPLIRIEKVNYEEINFSEYGGIIFTSTNAVKFLNTVKLDKNIKCFCVGNATEKKARSVGFQNTIAAEGNVTNLKELIIQSYESKNKELLYVSGETISVDLDQQLLSEGFKVKRIINYRVDHNQKFDEKFVNELKFKMPDMVYVYSQNSASSFLNFIKIYQTENLWMNTNLMCIGEKTSSILNEIKWKKIFLFNPGEEEFLLYKI